MKNLTLRSLLALLLAWAFSIQSALYGHSVEPTTPPAAESNCAAPPPSSFYVAGNTANSITLEWTEDIPNLYYWIDGEDLTAVSPLSSAVVQGNTYTYNSLPNGHEFKFTIRASYCEKGPPGESKEAFGSTIIISDDVVSFEQCNPTMSRTIAVGEPFSIHLQNSSSLPGAPLNNAYVANFRYFHEGAENPSILTFGLVYDKDESVVYLEKVADVPTDIFTLRAFNLNGLAAEGCFQGYNNGMCNTTVFKIISVEQEMNGDFAGLRMVFTQPVVGFTFCQTGGSPSFLQADVPSANTSKAKQLKQSAIALPVGTVSRPSPNPFSTATRINYILEKEGPVAIELFDALGRHVREIEHDALKPAGTWEAVVSGAGLPRGVYYLHLQTESSRDVFPVVKQE